MKKEIWAIGGGKGGTGKSVLSALFSLNEADEGRKVILIDGDLGGANIHTFFKISAERSSLNDFFEKKIPLSDTLIETGIPGLSLISGDMRSYNPLSVRYIQRLKFYREIRGLDADVIIIDLGAGSGLNTIDSFLLADRMILISTPEITSIENLYIFVKKIIIRKIKDMLSYDGFKEYEKDELASDLNLRDTLTFTDFIEKLRGIGERQERIVDMGLASLKVNIVLNQLKNRKFLKYGISLKSVLKRHFRINALYSGCFNYDDRVNMLANGDMAINEFFRSPEIRTELKKIIDNIKNEKDINFNELKK